MREFKDSIPLFVDLKNEALRERYVNVIVTKRHEVDQDNLDGDRAKFIQITQQNFYSISHTVTTQ